ncbi:SDR family oxidoreductase [Streptomyces sp. HPF1205]|uniref:SDR family oxidoreductase n=1 Tax=Streptomyces sp. HPF1205 TaxID=2873262 RepID=UPI001CEC91FB|nr:SDR family oxidoreductase [Streptomyces sp. HPF1205]
MSNNETSRAVLLTGASGGVGLATTRALAEQGYRVYAGVRNVNEFQGAKRNVHPIRLDVTDPESIAAAVESVYAKGDTALAGIVNNAGIIIQGPMELVPADDLRQQFEVNVLGPAAVTQAFLPLLRRGRGRLVNITASTARVPGPFFGPISASKAALQALSDALRLELAYWDIPVVVLEPGALETQIFAKAAAAQQKANAALAQEQLDLYAEQLEAVGAAMAKMKPSPPSILADAVLKALTVKKPKPRYKVGPDTRLVGVISRLPLSTRDGMLAGVMGIKKLHAADA